jgi:carbon monoxide dehydrogenase subunit G
MAPIVNSIEISRRPEDVFGYVTDPSHLPEWQESVVSVRGEGPYTVGSTVVVTRRVGRMEREMTSKIGELTPPRAWTIRGIDGPIRGDVKGTVEPLGDGEHSQVTIALDLEGHGLGKLLLPLIVRRQVEKEMPKNMETLKRQLETTP